MGHPDSFILEMRGSSDIISRVEALLPWTITWKPSVGGAKVHPEGIQEEAAAVSPTGPQEA